MKFYCPPKCKNGTIVKCDEEEKFAEDTTFTNEATYPRCPRYFEVKKPVPIKTKRAR
jgi:hypothetical protein